MKRLPDWARYPISWFGDTIQGLSAYLGMDQAIQNLIDRGDDKSRRYLDAFERISQSRNNRTQFLDKLSKLIDEMNLAGLSLGGNTATVISSKLNRLKDAQSKATAVSNSLQNIEDSVLNAEQESRSLGQFFVGERPTDSIKVKEEQANALQEKFSQIESSVKE